MIKVISLFARLPLGVLYCISDLLFVLIYYVARYRRGVVMDNLTRCFPDMSPAERKSTARRFYRNFTDYMVETLKLAHISDDEMRRRMEFVDLDVIDNAVDNGRSVAVYFSHCFNWEWAPSITLWTRHAGSDRMKFCQVYRPLANKTFDELMLKLRSRFGSLSFPKNTVFRDIIRACRNTGLQAVVGFMSDQHPSHGDLIHVVDFLNHPTAFITGTETLARKLNMGVIYWDMYKPRRGHYHIVSRLITDKITEEPVFSVTDRYADMLQESIRRNPSIWLWTHKRWKNPVTFADNEQPRHK